MNPVADYIDFLGELREVIARAGGLMETIDVAARLNAEGQRDALAQMHPHALELRDVIVAAMVAIDKRREAVESN